MTSVQRLYEIASPHKKCGSTGRRLHECLLDFGLKCMKASEAEGIIAFCFDRNLIYRSNNTEIYVCVFIK